jgi:NTE family protein
VYVLAPMASLVMDNPFNPATHLERLFRRVITMGLMREVRKVRATGAIVTVLTPGAEDLTAIGANMMNPARRRRVLETSLRTSPAAVLDNGNRYEPSTEAA